MVIIFSTLFNWQILFANLDLGVGLLLFMHNQLYIQWVAVQIRFLHGFFFLFESYRAPLNGIKGSSLFVGTKLCVKLN